VKQFTIDIGPKFHQYVPQTAVTQSDRRAADGQTETSVAFRVIGIGDSSSRESSEHIGKMKGVTARILSGNKLLLQCGAHALLNGVALTQTEIAWVLPKKHRIEEVAEEIAVKLSI